MKSNLLFTYLFKTSTCILLMLMASCTYHKVELKKNCDTIIPDTVSFANNIIPIFNSSCNTVGCHSGSHPEGHLNLEPSVAYEQLMKKGSGYIDTTNATSCLLYSQLISVSEPMPPTGKLDDCSIQLVLEWIKQGAKNN